MYFLLLTFLQLTLIAYVRANHFLGGSITAYPKSYSSTSVVLTISTRFAWTRVLSGYCDSATISSGLATYGYLNQIFCTLNCLTSNQVVGNTYTRCRAFSASDNWSYGTNTFDFTFPISNQIKMEFSSSAWAMNLVIGAGTGWNIKFTISTQNRTDIGRVNSAPTALIAPVVNVRQGMSYGIRIAYVDNDYDTVRCRWALASQGECGGICQAVPFGVLQTNDTCNMFVNTTVQLPGLFAAAIQLEDFDSPNSTTPLSSVPLQFMLFIKNVNSNCFTSPTIIGDIPVDSCLIINGTLSTRVVAQVGCTTENITDILILSATTTSLSSLIQQDSTTWYKYLNWTAPVASGVNSYIICSTATDSSLLSSSSSCFTLISGLSPPQVNPTSLTPNQVILTVNSSSDTQTFRCLFNLNKMRKPSATQSTIPYIRVFSMQDNQLMLKINSLLSGTTQFISNQEMTFSVNIGSFPPGDYYILFDWGVAVYDDYCFPLSEPITGSTIWTFSISKTTVAPTLEQTTIIFNSTPIQSPSKSGCESQIICIIIAVIVPILLFIVVASLVYYYLRMRNPVDPALTKIYSNKLKTTYSTNEQNATNPELETITILTLHDLGCDQSSFKSLQNSPVMLDLRDKIRWINIDLPGQEENALDLKLKGYPEISELADELKVILDHYKIEKSVILIGDGAGADIAAMFSMLNPERCFGLCLIRPTGSEANLNEKLLYVSSGLKGEQLESTLFSYISWLRFGHIPSDETNEKILNQMNEFKEEYFNKRNIENLDLLVSSYLRRPDLIKKLKHLNVPVLTVFSKASSFVNKSRKFQRKLAESRIKDTYDVVNTVAHLLTYEANSLDPLKLNSNEIAAQLRIFLETIGCLDLFGDMKKNEVYNII